MKKINSNILLTALGLIFSSANSFATECTPAPDCASLGYNKTVADCEGGDTIKCPTDTSKVYCLGGIGQNISAGAILYGDGSVDSNLISGKKPVGIVFDVVNRLAIAVAPVKKDGSAGEETMPWSSSFCDTPNLENCDQWESYITCGADGRANTDAILASTCNGTTYAANAANAYQPDGCSADFCKKGKWFLPSKMNLKRLYQVNDSVNKTLGLLRTSGVGVGNLKSEKYWSSTEDSEGKVWIVTINSHYVSPVVKNSNDFFDMYYVRPVVKY